MAATSPVRRVRVIVDARQAKVATAQINRELASIRKSAVSLNSTLRTALSAFAVYGTADALRKFIEFGSEVQALSGRVRALTGSLQEMSDVQTVLMGVANRTYSRYQDMVTLWTRLRIVTQSAGTGMKEIMTVAEAVANSFRLMGATGMEARAVMIQFAQGLGTGAIQGEELRSVIEGNAILAQELAKVFGIGTEELKEWGKAGKLATGQIIAGLVDAAPEIAKRAAELGVPLQQALNVLGNKFTEIMQRTIPALNALSRVVLVVADNLETLLNVLVIAAGAMLGGVFARGVQKMITMLAGLRASMLSVGVAAGIMQAAVAALPTLIGAAVAAVLLAWDDLSDMVRQWDTVWQIIKVKAERYVTEIEIFIRKAVMGWSQAISEFFAQPLQGIDLGSVFSFEIKKGGLADTVLSPIGGMIRSVGEEIKRITAPEIKEALENAVDAGASAAGSVVESVVGDRLGKPISEGLADSFSGMADQQLPAIKELDKGLQGLVDRESALTESLTSTRGEANSFKEAWDRLSGGLGKFSNASTTASGGAKKLTQELEELKREVRGLLDELFPVEAELRSYVENLELLTKANAKGVITTEQLASAEAQLATNLEESLNPMISVLENWQQQTAEIGKTSEQIEIMRVRHEANTQAALLDAAGQMEMAAAVRTTADAVEQQIQQFSQLQKRTNAIQESAQSLAQTFTSAWEKMFEGGANFKDLLQSIAKEITAMINKALIMKPLEQMFNNLLSGAASGGGAWGSLIGQIFAGGAGAGGATAAAPASARGNVLGPRGLVSIPEYSLGGAMGASGPLPTVVPQAYAAGGAMGMSGPIRIPRFALGGVFSPAASPLPRPFAAGGVVDKLSYFTTGGNSNFLGSLAEEGPEAIMPLKRGSDGKLGVEGGNTTNINVTVMATDADSFRRSRGTWDAELIQALGMAQQRYG